LLIGDSIAKNAAKEGAFTDLITRLMDQAYADLELMKGVAFLAPLYDYLVKIHIPICAAGHVNYYKKALKLA
jgi:hypothetical protein